MIPSSTTITEQGRRTRRTLLWVGGLVVLLNLLVWVGGFFSSGGAVSGPDGSSYVTTRAGTAALAGTLERLGFDVERIRTPLDQVSLDPAGTVVLADVGDADFTSAELNHLETMMRAGGRVLAMGRLAAAERLVVEPPQWRSEGASAAEPTGPLDEGAPDRVALSGFGSLDLTPEDRPLLVAEDGRVIAAERPLGDGHFVWLADSFPAQNQGLGTSGAAVAAVTLVDPDGPVYFDEFRHGYRDEGSFWSLLPVRWQTVLVMTGVVAMLGLVAYGRRFGPAYDRHRRLPPGRELYLDSVAGILHRSGDTAAALDGIRTHARQLLDREGRGVDLDPEARAALLGDEVSEQALMAADRGLAILTREKA
jgi:hypothetical protein